MMQYTCPICHRLSYSAAGPDTANSDKCLNPNCTGRVKLAEPNTPKREIPYGNVIQMVRKEAKRND